MSGKGDSYKQILKSTSIVGGSQIASILIGVFKTKIIAILLGAEGIGIAGILQNIIDIVRNITGFGINFSGVKNIAEAAHSNDDHRISEMSMVLKRWALATGVIGGVLLMILSIPFSIYSFGNSSYAIDIALLSLVVLTSSVSSAQIALLQGLRRIKQMAKATLFGAVAGLIITLPLYYFFGNRGIVPGMLLTSFSALFISSMYARKISFIPVEQKAKQTFLAGLGMAKLGFFIVINGFVASTSLYVIRALILSFDNIEMVGYFQAVWTISTLYLNILLNSMLADYFPRLSAISLDVVESNKLMNEQLVVTLLIGAPMLAAMMYFSPFVLKVLYSGSFAVVTSILKWHMLSSYICLISWCLGVLFLAKGRGELSIVGETLKQLTFVSLVYLGWKSLNSEILGIGFFVGSCINLLYVLFCVLKLWKFRFSKENLSLILKLSIVVFAIFYLVVSFDSNLASVLSFSILMGLCVFCFYELDRIIGVREKVKHFFKK